MIYNIINTTVCALSVKRDLISTAYTSGMWKIDQILALCAPFECLGCGYEGNLLCHQCGIDAIPFPLHLCYRCLQPSSQEAICRRCLTKTNLDHVWVAASYKQIAVQLIARLKFARTQAAAPLIAQVMTSHFPPLPVETIVVHIPTANQRVRQRGYDQAQLIARELARYRRLPYQALLRRHGHTRQVGANRQERFAQLEAAFYCPKPSRVAGKRIILIDDVLTTGATIESAARVMKDAGAVEVSAGLFAQKL